MKYTFVHDDSLEDEEVVIKYATYSPLIAEMHTFLGNHNKTMASIELFRGNEEHYIKISDILFFETEDGNIYAHTSSESFLCKMKLYELEEIVPLNFTRISKSTLCNISYISSIDRRLTSSSLVKFSNSLKEAYVSRLYYQDLKSKLEQRLFKQ